MTEVNIDEPTVSQEGKEFPEEKEKYGFRTFKYVDPSPPPWLGGRKSQSYVTPKR